MIGGKGIGRVGYDKKELDAMEKGVERVEKGDASPTKTPTKTPGRGKGKEREVRKSTSMKEVLLPCMLHGASHVCSVVKVNLTRVKRSQGYV